MKKRVKITVIKTSIFEDIVKQYGPEGFGTCPVHKEGEVFYTGFGKPDGFCDEAWKAIYQFVFSLWSGGDEFYFGDWLTVPGVAIGCCNDGLRPVVFRIERDDIEN